MYEEFFCLKDVVEVDIVDLKVPDGMFSYLLVFSNIYPLFVHLPSSSVLGMWSGWSAWSKCSSSCGNGQQSRKRECNNPKPDHGGDPCVGPSIVFQNCVEKECPGTSIFINDIFAK